MVGWSPVSSMPTPRHDVSAAFVGSRLHVVGGDTDPAPETGEITVHESWVLGDGPSWETRAPYPLAQRSGVAVSLDGVLHVVGGFNAANPAYAQHYAYDPGADAWSARAPLPAARRFPAGGVIDGLFYIAGGATAGLVPSALAWVYDPGVDAWSSVAPMPVARVAPAWTVAAGRLYVVGGFDGATSPQSSNYRYDPGADAWATLAPMPTARFGAGGATLAGEIHVFGGIISGISTNTQAHEVYNPSSGTWRSLDVYPDSNRWVRGATGPTGIFGVGGFTTENVPSIYALQIGGFLVGAVGIG